MINRTCCFFGHRKIENTVELRTKLYTTIEKLIVDENIDTFLFGSKSEFNSLCHELVTKIKEKHPHIKRVYVRAEYPYVDENYIKYLLEDYEHTYFPEHIKKAGRAAYVERNRYMIDQSNICVFNYRTDYIQNCCWPQNGYAPLSAKSGTGLAYEYASKKGQANN